jgi:peptidyl-prolyl cis-trans isomerase D
MALIGKIRKNFWFVLILLGLALAAFVIMDVSSAAGLGGGQTNLKVGEVNGQEINYRDFQRTEQIYFGNQGDPYQTRENVWNYYVEKSIVDKESEKLGIDISRDELIDLQFGNVMSPIMQRNWTSPQTGQIDRNQLNSFKTAIENGDDLDPRFREFWAEQEEQIVKFHKQNKINNLVSKAIFTPAWMAEGAYKEQNGTVDFDYVKVPFDKISDSEITLEDADYTSYLNANKDKYTNEEETRTIEYVVFDVNATDEDRTKIFNEMTALKAEFAATTNDSLFAFSNDGFYRHLYYSDAQLDENFSESIKGAVRTMEPGQIVGPLEESGFYRNIKLIDKKVVPDSVKARHILLRGANARATADSLLGVLRRGAERFDSLAVKFSVDPGSKNNGGDLGYFDATRMLAPFTEACFYEGKIGDYKIQTTTAGTHLIHIQDQKFLDKEPKYKLAFVNQAIIPSTETQDKINEEVADIVASHPYLDDMINVISQRDDVSFDRVSNIKANDYQFADLPSGNTSRDIIRWAFNGGTETNDMAPDVFIYTEPNLFYNNKYVIAGLKSIEPKGLRTLASVKDELAPILRNEKKGAIISSNLSGKSLEASAAEYNVSIESANGVGYNTRFLPVIGSEPKVMASAIGSDLNTGNVVVGNSGVFIVTPTNRTEAGTAPDLPAFRKADANTARSKVTERLMASLRKLADVSDSRFTFF